MLDTWPIKVQLNADQHRNVTAFCWLHHQLSARKINPRQVFVIEMPNIVAFKEEYRELALEFKLIY